MAEFGDLMNEWKSLNTPGKVVLGGAVIGVGLIAWGMRKKSSTTSVNVTPQSQSVPTTSDGTFGVTSSGPTTTDLMTALQGIATQVATLPTSTSTSTTTTSTPAPAPAPVPVATSTPAPAYNPFPATNFYLSQPGDTINAIAAAHGTTAYALEHTPGNWTRVDTGQIAMGQNRSGQSNFWDLLPWNTWIQFK